MPPKATVVKRKIPFPTFEAPVRGQDVPATLPCLGTPHPSREHHGWEFARLSPPSQAGSGLGERLPWQLQLRGEERSPTRGSPRVERHDTEGEGSP